MSLQSVLSSRFALASPLARACHHVTQSMHSTHSMHSRCEVRTIVGCSRLLSNRARINFTISLYLFNVFSTVRAIKQLSSRLHYAFQLHLRRGVASSTSSRARGCMADRGDSGQAQTRPGIYRVQQTSDALRTADSHARRACRTGGR